MKTRFTSCILIFVMLLSLTAYGQQDVTVDSLPEKMSEVDMDKYYRLP